MLLFHDYEAHSRKCEKTWKHFIVFRRYKRKWFLATLCVTYAVEAGRIIGTYSVSMYSMRRDGYGEHCIGRRHGVTTIKLHVTSCRSGCRES